LLLASGDIDGNGLSRLLMTGATAFAELERDRIRARMTQVKRDQGTWAVPRRDAGAVQFSRRRQPRTLAGGSGAGCNRPGEAHAWAR
jgi:hypothetical protein